MSEQSRPTPGPTLPELLRWLLSITRPVHPPLLVSLAFRVINLSLDLALFATAAAGVVTLIDGGDGVARLLITLVVLSLLKAGAFYGEQFTGHYVAFKALELLRGYVFARLWPKAPAIVSHARSGDILTSLTRDVDRIEVVYAHTFAPVVSAYIVGTGGILLAGLWLGWAPVSVAAICLAISLLVVPYLGTRASMGRTKQVLSERRALTHHVSDTIFGLDEVLGYGRGHQRLHEMDDEGERVARLSTLPRDFTGLRRGANITLSLIATGSIVVLGSGHMAPAIVAGLAAAAFRAFEGPRGIEDATGYLDHSLAAARRLWEISHAPELVHDGPSTLHLDAGPEVSFDAVTYTYPGAWDAPEPSTDTDAVYAVEDISLTIPAGGHTILVGRSGSGKSTLVQLLQRYDDPTHGRITIAGRPLRDFTLDSLRRTVVSVSQKNDLLQATIAENLRLGAPGASDAELWNALETAGLSEEVRAMPEGLDTHVGKSGVALSGGQVQRLCLARALLMRPAVLILDEFTANLNLELEHEIRQRLRNALPTTTIIEVTHRLRATEQADVIAVLDQGNILALGTPQEVTHHAIEEYFRVSQASL